MFEPDYRNIEDCARNKKPRRIPLYEHGIDDGIMEGFLGKKFAHLRKSDPDGYFSAYCSFFRQMGYDTVTFEGCITPVLPHGGALAHPGPGYIDGREKFESYPWEEVREIYAAYYDGLYAALRRNMPRGMKAIGGVGNGVFEIAQDLAGYENLCLLSYDDPALYAGLFCRIGEMMEGIWKDFLEKFGDIYCVCRFGDDLGYKINTMLPPDDIRKHIIPQYKRVIDLVHAHGKPFLLHSCGCIFSVFGDLIAAGVDAKHSNEDQIAPMRRWVEEYGDKIGNFGGVDTDHLVRKDDVELKKIVEDVYRLAAEKNGGFAIGSGNSIPDYVKPQKYALMVETVRRLRGDYD